MGKCPPLCVEDCQRGFATSLVHLKLRAPVVDAVTSLPSGETNRLWHKIHGKASPPGRFPDSVANCLTSTHLAVGAAMFVHIYCTIDRRAASLPNAPDLIKAFRVFQHLWPHEPIDSNILYYAVRDVQSGVVTWQYCKGCRAGYIHSHTKQKTQRCPFCSASNRKNT